MAFFAVAAIAGLQPQAKAQTLIDLGTAWEFSILAGTSVSNTGVAIVNGDLGVSPGTTVTGFGGDGNGIVNGTIYVGSSSLAALAETDLSSAYDMAEGESITGSGVTTLSGATTLTPGVYNLGTGIAVPLGTTITLNGNNDSNPVFIFQSGSTLTTASDTQFILENGAQASDVFWQVTSSATLNSSDEFVGNVLANVSITMTTDATVDGRLLAENGAVVVDGNTFTAVPEPAPTSLLIAGFVGLIIGVGRIRGHFSDSNSI
jgi:hypothetical protein